MFANFLLKVEKKKTLAFGLAKKNSHQHEKFKI
jgi:hypothetical protein